MNKTPHPRRKNTEGVALLMSLLFVVILAAIVTDFMYKMHVEASLVANQSSDHSGYLAAKSGIATGMSVLHADRLMALEEQATEGSYDGADEPWAEKSSVTSYNDDVVNITISDEYGKINLNALIYEDESGAEIEHPVLVPMLVELFTVTFNLENDPTDLILDWLDADDNERPNGAESNYYESLETPYSCKNGPMDSIEELLLLPGITPELYFGLPPVEEEKEFLEVEYDEEVDGVLAPGQTVPLFDLFTVHGHPEGKLNVNTMPMAEELETMIVQYYNESLQDKRFELTANGTAIVSRQSEEGGFATEADLQEAGLAYNLNPEGSNNNNQNTGTEPLVDPPRQIFTTQSNVFRIWSDGQSGEAQVRIEAYLFRDPVDNTENPEPQLFRIIDWRVVR